MAEANPAPGALETVRAFVNTFDAEHGTDELGSPGALASWLAGHGLLDPGERAHDHDLASAVTLREALRAVLRAHHGEPVEPGAAAVLDAAARRADLYVTFGSDGEAVTRACAGGVPGALGGLLAIVAAAQAEGTWARLKVCPADDCRWAFYDASRNRSAVWCAVGGSCANRAKVRAYRERQAARHAH